MPIMNVEQCEFRDDVMRTGVWFLRVNATFLDRVGCPIPEWDRWDGLYKAGYTPYQAFRLYIVEGPR